MPKSTLTLLLAVVATILLSVGLGTGETSTRSVTEIKLFWRVETNWTYAQESHYDDYYGWFHTTNQALFLDSATVSSNRYLLFVENGKTNEVKVEGEAIGWITHPYTYERKKIYGKETYTPQEVWSSQSTFYISNRVNLLTNFMWEQRGFKIRSKQATNDAK